MEERAGSDRTRPAGTKSVLAPLLLSCSTNSDRPHLPSKSSPSRDLCPRDDWSPHQKWGLGAVTLVQELSEFEELLTFQLSPS